MRRLEADVRANSGADTLAQLGLAYQLRWRETGDASFLPRSGAALRRAFAKQPDDPIATLGLGSLALIQHDFRGALRLGRKARVLAPDSARPYAVVGDALLELGRYDEAFEAFEQMVATKPTLAGYARIAYARELRGDREGAIAAMRLALDTAGGVPEPTAWTLVELAKLELGSGRVSRAEQALREARRVFPDTSTHASSSRACLPLAASGRPRSPRHVAPPRRSRCHNSSRSSATSSSGAV